jgi:NAD dependent epimerase/dehydratase family enzyme
MISWVALDDVIGAIYHALMTEQVAGAVNVVAPDPVSNQEFTRLLSLQLKRKALLNLSEKLLKWLGGEMAEEMMLSSAHVLPEQLLKTGYHFRYSSLTEFFKLFYA